MDSSTSRLVFLSFVAFGGAQLFKGQQCTTSAGATGFCERADLCASIREEIRQNRKPAICSFEGRTPIVCCADPRQSVSKANKKCEDYKLVSRNQWNVLPENSKSLGKFNSSLDWFAIIGGDYTAPKTFPHMAAIGFGDAGSISWLCGGSLISEQYVLTAAHCVSAGARGLARWILLGVLDLTQVNSDDHAQLFQVVEWIRHPDFKSYSKYHDIALLKLDREVRIDDYVRPACLQVDHDIGVSFVTALGWGLVDWADEKGSNRLMNVTLPLVSTSECSMTYRSLIGTRKLMFGIQDDKMLCAGLSSGGKDTCRGDSGGPLQYGPYGRDQPSRVVGVTSFGLTVCGAKNSPAVYTRVSYYVPWIESIVWPWPIEQNKAD